VSAGRRSALQAHGFSTGANLTVVPVSVELSAGNE
jgi:hypothetical protein